MEMLEHIPTQSILFFILYGITGVVPFLGALYLLLRRANAFAPGVTPPLRLRRWAAAFLSVASLGHVWWLLYFIFSNDMHSVTYMAVVAFDFVGMVITIAGTMLSMLQDRRRPIWPAFVAMMPYLIVGLFHMLYPDGFFFDMAIAYSLLLYLLFFIYMLFAIRRYGRWLDDNYADLENKSVWLSQAVSLAYVLLFVLYVLVDKNFHLLYFLHAAELLFFGLLLWRVETLPDLNSLTPDPSPKSLNPDPSPKERGVYTSSAENSDDNTNHSPLLGRGAVGEAVGRGVGGEASIEHLLTVYCVAPQLYLQHDLTLQQLAQAIGTNRSYLSQYFSSRGITYNTYINNLRIEHFISHYKDVAAAGQPIVARQMASESGYRSYSTFSLAFKQRTGQSVTAWIRETGG